ncbi:uncharacterized protein LOC126852020 [Cataglyphis hispanica]|uniref:uncharacterized protein LOC126852020 n=1 Tax=Cataglyphis hispanica TaxID=1086592 RepID=UPI0021800822|nr:uncharacterized protein LOC126852020 [Cataglyphis hispanica]XP_050452442.1 uncharacterized protein LOC126852020 [Cataglyphis hispanica]
MSSRNSEFRLELYNLTEIRECTTIQQYTTQEQGIQTDKVWSQDYALDEMRARNRETQDREVQTDPPSTIGTQTDHKPPESATIVPLSTVTKLEQPNEHDRIRDLRVDLTLARSGQACRAKFSLHRSSPGSSSIRSSLTPGRSTSSLREESSRRAIASGCQSASPGRSFRRKFKTGKFFENASRPVVCWNCRSAQHYYSDCPWPRERQYCYGCGRDGVTLRTCPSCGIEWKNSGTYHPDMGHLGTRKFSKQLTIDTSSVSSPE